MNFDNLLKGETRYANPQHTEKSNALRACA